MGYSITGLRRIGKTSLLREFVQRIKANENTVPIYLDISGVHPFTIENLYDQIFLLTIEAFKEKKKLPFKLQINEAIKGSFEAFSSLMRSTEISSSIKDYVDLKFRLKENKANLQDLLNQSLKTVEELSKETSSRAILIFDEFQFINDLDETLIWAIRAVIQNWKNSSVVVAGSEMFMMKQMTALDTSAFYMLLKNMKLEPFDEHASFSMMDDKFKKAGLKADRKVVKKIFDLTQGYPFYLQWLGDKIYDLGVKTVNEESVSKAYENMLHEGDILFSAEIEKVSSGEKDILIEIALTEASISDISKKINKPLSTVAKFVERLVNKSYLVKIKPGSYDLIDAMLKNWLRKKHER